MSGVELDTGHQVGSHHLPEVPGWPGLAIFALKLEVAGGNRRENSLPWEVDAQFVCSAWK